MATVYLAGDVKHRSEEHTSELQSRPHLVCRLLLEKKKNIGRLPIYYSIPCRSCYLFFFFFNDPATTEIYPLSLHDALPILGTPLTLGAVGGRCSRPPQGRAEGAL